MKLADWLRIPNPDGSRKRKRDFAARVGVTQTMITEYAEGRAWPGRERMESIARVTDGLVTPNDFVDLPVARSDVQTAPDGFVDLPVEEPAQP